MGSHKDKIEKFAKFFSCEDIDGNAAADHSDKIFKTTEPTPMSCPFCGSSEFTFRQRRHLFFRVRCSGCYCEGPLGDEMWKEGAVKSWNRRHTEKEIRLLKSSVVIKDNKVTYTDEDGNVTAYDLVDYMNKKLSPPRADGGAR